MTGQTPTNAFNRRKLTAINFQGMPYMDEYLDQLFAEGRKPGQIRMCRLALHYFTQHMQTQNILIPDDITRQALVRYQGWMTQQKHWSDSYRVELLKKVRTWLNWMVNVGYLPTSPWLNIRTGITVKKPKPLSDDELNDLFSRHRQDAFSATPFTYHRRETILVMLYGWGLRLHELVALDIDDISTDRTYVRAINKGGSYKTLPYLDEIKMSVRRYETWRARHAIPGEAAAFINRSGSRMTTGDVWQIIHDLGQRAGVVVNPHRFRDTCATHLLDSDMAIERVAQILGHRNTRTTLGYAKVNDHKVAEALDAAMSPRLNGLIFGRTSNVRKESA